MCRSYLMRRTVGDCNEELVENAAGILCDCHQRRTRAFNLSSNGTRPAASGSAAAAAWGRPAAAATRGATTRPGGTGKSGRADCALHHRHRLRHLLLRESSEGAKFRHGGIYGQACSRSSGLGAFSGCGISPDSVPRLRRLHSYGSALRLCRSSLVGTGPRGTAWVWATDLRTTTLPTDSCLPSAAGGARLLHSAVSRSFAAVI